MNFHALIGMPCTCIGGGGDCYVYMGGGGGPGDDCYVYMGGAGDDCYVYMMGGGRG